MIRSFDCGSEQSSKKFLAGMRFDGGYLRKYNHELRYETSGRLAGSICQEQNRSIGAILDYLDHSEKGRTNQALRGCNVHSDE
jgi:hypothetical protein